MINVTVNGTEQIKCNKGDNLYQVLTAAGYVFAGNCGMKDAVTGVWYGIRILAVL